MQRKYLTVKKECGYHRGSPLGAVEDSTWTWVKRIGGIRWPAARAGIARGEKKSDRQAKLGKGEKGQPLISRHGRGYRIVLAWGKKNR